MPIEPVVRAAGRRPTIIPKPRRWGRRRVTPVTPSERPSEPQREPMSRFDSGQEAEARWTKSRWQRFWSLLARQKKKQKTKPSGEPPEGLGQHIDIRV